MRSFSGSNTDRRRAERYVICCPVEIQKEIGTTCNQSVTGVLFKTNGPFTEREPVNLFIVLERYEDLLTRIRCQGKVVRVEPCGKYQNVAVDIRRFQFTA